MEKDKINIPLYGPNLAPRQKKNTINLGSQFTSLGANVVIIKYFYFEKIHILGDVPINSLQNPNVGPKMKQQKNKIVGALSLIHITSGVGGCVETLDGTRMNSQTKIQDKINMHNQGKKTISAS